MPEIKSGFTISSPTILASGSVVGVDADHVIIHFLQNWPVYNPEETSVIGVQRSVASSVGMTKTQARKLAENILELL